MTGNRAGYTATEMDALVKSASAAGGNQSRRRCKDFAKRPVDMGREDWKSERCEEQQVFVPHETGQPAK